MYNQKTARMTEEDQRIREENLEARENYCEEGVRALRAAVCLQAVADYKSAMKGKVINGNEGQQSPAATLRECTRFITEENGVFSQITGIHDAERAINMVRRVPAGFEQTLQKRK